MEAWPHAQPQAADNNREDYRFEALASHMSSLQSQLQALNAQFTGYPPVSPVQTSPRSAPAQPMGTDSYPQSPPGQASPVANSQPYSYTSTSPGYQRTPLSTRGPWHSSYAPGGANRGRGGYRGGRLPRDVCRFCRQQGHWGYECPNVNNEPPSSDLGAGAAATNTRNVSVLTPSSDTYVEISVFGKRHCALIDTGSERSLMPRRLIPRVPLELLKKTDLVLVAANGAELSCLGILTFRYTLDGRWFKTDLLVSEDVSELIFGYDWLAEHGCEWSFKSKTIQVDGHLVRLYNRPSKANVRRVYAREDIIVSPGTEANVPVIMPYSSLRTPKQDWLVDTQKVAPGIFAARTLLSNEDRYAAVHFLNVSTQPYVVKAGRAGGGR